MVEIVNDNDKVEAYLKTVEDYVISPIRGEVGKHCVASLLLIFAAIDGIARLVDSDPSKVGDRFKRIIGTLGSAYEAKSSELYELRNCIVHNALNTATFISQAALGAEHHLKDVGGPGELYVNTRVFCEDLAAALTRLRERFAADSAFLAEAASRLEVYESDYINELDFPTTKPISSYFRKFVKTRDSTVKCE